MSSRYEIYRKLLTSTKKKAGKLDKDLRKLSELQFAKLLTFQAPNFVNTIDFNIMADEHYWNNSGNRIIFPGNNLMIKSLLSANFELNENAIFELPFDSFILGMPSDTIVNGHKLPSIMVTHFDYDKVGEQFIGPFCDAIDIPTPMINYEKESRGDRSVAISYKDLNSEAYVRFLCSEKKLATLLKCKSYTEFRDSMPSLSESKDHAIALDESDFDIEFTLFRLVAALGVYHSATEGKKLREGLPEFLPKKLERQTNYIPETFYFDSLEAKGESPSQHVRAWTFRNLKHDRFYRNEYKDVPKGSRWVFVDSCVVGAKSDSYTQD